MNNSSGKDNHCWCELGHESYSTIYKAFNFTIVMLVVPIIATFGFMNNIVNVYVYTRPASLRESTCIYLAALSASDLFTNFSALMVSLDSAKAYSILLRKVLSPLLVRVWPLSQIATTCSIYFTVGAAVDCFVKVCWDNKSISWNNLRRSGQFVVAVIAGSLMYNFPRFWELESVTCIHPETNETRSEVCPTDFRLSFFSHKVYNVYMHMGLMIFTPLLILTVLNTMIVLRVREQRRVKQHIASFAATFHSIATRKRCYPGETSSKEDDSNDSTATLVMVVVLFLLCNIFGLITNVADSIFNVNPQVLNYLVDVTNVLTTINASANFLIYITYDMKYRDSFRKDFLRMRSMSTVPKLMVERIVSLTQTNSGSRVSSLGLRSYSSLSSGNRSPSFSGTAEASWKPPRVFENEIHANNENQTLSFTEDEELWVKRQFPCGQQAQTSEEEKYIGKTFVPTSIPDFAENVMFCSTV